MKTLLKIFFYPYLQFLLKIHLFVVIALFLVFVLQVNELVYFAPQIYGLAIYMFMTRHTFKQNISWMLATFNKKTLVQYHLASQTLMMGVMFVLNLIFGVTVMTLANVLLPKEKVLTQNPLLTKVARDEFSNPGMNLHSFIDSFWSTRETIWVYIAIFFFFSIIYSPVNAQEQFKKMHEKRNSSLKYFFWIYASVLAGGFIFVSLSLHEYMIPILSLVFVLGITYVSWTYNNVFLFLPRKKLVWGAPILGAIFIALNFWMFDKSLKNYHETSSSDRKVRELLFMSNWAPPIDNKALLSLLGDVQNEDLISDVRRHTLYRRKLLPEQILAYFEVYPTPSMARMIVLEMKTFKLDDLEKYHTREHILWLAQTTDEERKIKTEEIQALTKNYDEQLKIIRAPANVKR